MTFFTALIFTGSRGPLISLLVTTFVAALYLAPSGFIKRIILFSPFIAASLYIVLKLISTEYLRGFSIGGIGDEGYQQRSALFEYTWFTILSEPGGIGIGNFFHNSFSYPHNIFLEVLIEWGIIFGLCFVLFVVFGVALCFFQSGLNDVFKLLALYEFMNSQVSGDITSPRLLYALCFLGWMFWLFKKSDGKQKSQIEKIRRINLS